LGSLGFECYGTAGMPETFNDSVEHEGGNDMGNVQSLSSLSGKDSMAIQEVIDHLLLECKTRPALKAIFESRILPLLNADSALYAWTDPDLLSPKLIDSINIPEEELALVDEFINKDPEAGALLTHSRPVIARDIEIPKYSEVTDPFQGEFLREDPFLSHGAPVREGYDFFSTSKIGVITLALRDPNLGAGIHRRLPCDKPWSVRDVCVLEHIRTPLLMAIKTIVLTEELATQRSIVDILAGSPTAIAVVDSEMRVSYSNPAWTELMTDEAGQELNTELKSILQKEKSKCDPPFASNAFSGTNPICKLSDRDCRLDFSPLRGDDLGDKDPWLLQVKPLAGRNPGSEGPLWEAGLTKREMEACELLRQGIDPQEIAERLFISPHTVKTHLKRIHRKLGVHTRAQLVAALNR
jgi:DNA-binding CsgD family transcriptional regulator